MNKTAVFAVIALLAAVGAGAYVWMSSSPMLVPPSETPGEVAVPSLTPEVEEIMKQKIALAKGLAADATLLGVVKEATAKNSALGKDEIASLDASWRTAKDGDSFVAQFMSNAGAEALKKFQALHPEFKEIFATDAFGLNAAQTNKTSDYLQADEEWWTRAWAGGTGMAYYGDIEFDESSQTEAISIYVPIMGDTNAVGVLKAVLDLASVKSAL